MVATVALWPIMAPMSARIGSLAPQGTKVVSMMVMRRSFSFSMVRVAMTPGTPQPMLTMSGMTDLPLSPMARKMRSSMNATRAM